MAIDYVPPVIVRLGEFDEYDFTRIASESDAPPVSGVYAVLSPLRKGVQALYIGESGNIRRRLEKHHDWRTCWIENSMPGGFFFAYYKCSEPRRMAIEKELRIFHKPICGERPNALDDGPSLGEILGRDLLK